MSAPPPRKVLHLPKIRMLSRGGRLAAGVRITDVRNVRPSSTGSGKKQEDTLRAQLQKEIASRARSCAYAGYECWCPVVAGRRYCATHVLNDPTAPYTACAHKYPSGDTCPMPAPLTEGRSPGLCFEHARSVLLSRQRSAAPPPPVTTTETLLHQLSHYVQVERPRTTSCASSVSVVSDPADNDLISPNTVDPFEQIDSAAINQAYSNSLLEYQSCSESDGEDITLGPEGNCRHTVMYDEVEQPSTEETPLWRAGVFTAEEAVSETKAALCALQAAYLKQAQRCNVLLKMARKDYLKNLKLEKEQYCSINSQARSGPLSVRERRQLRKLKAFASYHRKHGVDAVLARKLHHKRVKVKVKAESGGKERPIPSIARCVFTEGGVRCPTHALPAAKHCAKHILLDTQQVLYRACGDTRGPVSCGEAAPRLPLPSDRCRYHTDVPTYTVFSLKKEESGSDSETDTGTDISMLNDSEALDQTT